MGRRRGCSTLRCDSSWLKESVMPQINDLSRSLTVFEQDRTLVVVVEVSLSSWLVGGVLPGVARQPMKKLGPDKDVLLALLWRWKDEASRSGREIRRVCVAYEAGRDGFWLARSLLEHGIETYVIHSASVSVSREQRRAKTDRLDTELLKRTVKGTYARRCAALNRGERGRERETFFSPHPCPTGRAGGGDRPKTEKEKSANRKFAKSGKAKKRTQNFAFQTSKTFALHRCKMGFAFDVGRSRGLIATAP
jgi:transposase